MITKQDRENGISCKGICFNCKEVTRCIQGQEWKERYIKSENDKLLKLVEEGILDSNFEVKEGLILWSADNDTVKIPTKRDEDSDYDIYANFKEDYMIIQPHETRIIPTNLRCAMNKKWRLKLEERGSTGTKAMIQNSGVIDSGFRGAIGVPITNGNNKPLIILKSEPTDIIKELAIVYPYTKAICQAKLDEVPKVESKSISSDILTSIPSERGEGMIGSSGK